MTHQNDENRKLVAHLYPSETHCSLLTHPGTDATNCGPSRRSGQRS